MESVELWRIWGLRNHSIRFEKSQDGVKVSFGGDLSHVRATSALKELGKRDWKYSIGFRVCIFVESVVGGCAGVWFCLSLSAFLGTHF